MASRKGKKVNKEGKKASEKVSAKVRKVVEPVIYIDISDFSTESGHRT